MGLNKVKAGSNMYQFVTHTWNPLAGQCPHGCTYCSTNKLKRYPVIREKYSGPIRLQESELKTNLGDGNFIFVAAQNDLFADEVPREIIIAILEYCEKFDNEYFFQSKNPDRMLYNLGFYALGTVVCTTIETNRFYERIMGNNVPWPKERAMVMSYSNLHNYVTIEPIMDFDLPELVGLVEICEPVQVNIGADSGNNGLPEPSAAKVRELIARLEQFTIVNQKKNLARLLEVE